MSLRDRDREYIYIYNMFLILFNLWYFLTYSKNIYMTFKRTSSIIFVILENKFTRHILHRPKIYERVGIFEKLGGSSLAPHCI